MINIISIQITLILSVLLSHVTSTVYYMIPTSGNQSCPTDQECHSLSYYINNITLPSNVTLLFINGEHLLKSNEILQIQYRYNVTLLGQGQLVQSFHWSVMQSSVINVFATTIVHINGITIANLSTSIVINSVLNTRLNHVSVQNSSEFGLSINKAATVTIDSCSFSCNGVNTNFHFVQNTNIGYSNFTFGYQYTHDGTGLYIESSGKDNVSIEIFGCSFHSNDGQSVGGVGQ